jgi:hypothetical protein
MLYKLLLILLRVLICMLQGSLEITPEIVTKTIVNGAELGRR